MSKKVLFICSAGMSTSLLVTKTLKVAEERGIDIEIFALSEAQAKNYYDGCSAIMLGPQVRFLLDKVKKSVEGKGIAVEVINQMSYGRMDGNAVLDQILRLIEI